MDPINLHRQLAGFSIDLTQINALPESAHKEERRQSLLRRIDAVTQNTLVLPSASEPAINNLKTIQQLLSNRVEVAQEYLDQLEANIKRIAQVSVGTSAAAAARDTYDVWQGSGYPFPYAAHLLRQSEDAKEVRSEPDYGNPEPRKKEEAPSAGPGPGQSVKPSESDYGRPVPRREHQEPAPRTNTIGGVHVIPPGRIQNIKGLNKRGFFGMVYKGLFQNRPVAIKTLQVGIVDKQEAFEWEVTRLASLSHPNLVRFHGLFAFIPPPAGVSPGVAVYNEYNDRSVRTIQPAPNQQPQPSFVMEFCEGGSLQDLLSSDRPLPWSHRWQIAWEITLGLAYVHHQGVIHRDLKAENILLDKRGRAKLADLGVAQVDALLQQSEAEAVAKGLSDVCFKAPEEFRGEASTTATDIYALGLVFWQLVTRQVPFEKWTVADQKAASNGPPAIPADCPKEFRALIESCCALDPRARPNAEALVLQLDTLAERFHPQSHAVRICIAMDLRIDEYRDRFTDYIPLYGTTYSVDEDLDRYWEQWEGKEKDATAKDAPQLLETIWQTFLKEDQNQVLILYGDGGLGKSLSTNQLADRLLDTCWEGLQQPEAGARPPRWLPIFIRPGLATWSHAALTDGIATCLKTYRLDAAALRNEHILFFLDGYDELQADIEPRNLPTQLGLSAFPHAKLIVTCRRYVVKQADEVERFGHNGRRDYFYLLPLRIDQLMKSLGQRLFWNAETQASYADRIQAAPKLRSALRNPFLLSLFVQSWSTVSKQDFSRLNRSRIYAAFIEHWLTTHKDLLPGEIAAKGPQRLLEEFQAFSELMAFNAYQQSTLSLEVSKQAPSLWLQLKELAARAGRQGFAERQRQLTPATQHRAILSENDYVRLMQEKADKFIKLSPLKQREQQIEFIHKSFFEYFAACFLISCCKSGDLYRCIGALSCYPIQKELGIVHFFTEMLDDRCKELLFQIIETSKIHVEVAQASANGATLLNAAGVDFSGMDFSGIRIPGADLSGGICDYTQFVGADLTRVNLQSTWLRQANFSRTQLRDVRFGERPYIEMHDGNKISDLIIDCAYSPKSPWLAVTDGKKIDIYNAIKFTLDKSFRVGRLDLGPTKIYSTLAWDVTGEVLMLQFNPVIIWDVGSGRELHRFTVPHLSEVIAFRGRANRLATVKKDNSVLIFDVFGNREIGRLEGHSDEIKDIAWDPRGERLAAMSSKTVRVWEVSSGIELCRLQRRVARIAWDPSGMCLAAADYIGNVRVWDVSSGQELCCLKARSRVECLVWDVQGERLALGEEDATVSICDVRSGRELRCIRGSEDSISQVSWDARGGHLVSVARYGKVRVWEVNNSPELRYWKEPLEGSINTLSLDQLGELLVFVSNDIIKVWSTDDGSELVSLSNDFLNYFGARNLCIQQMILGSFKQIKVCDLISGHQFISLIVGRYGCWTDSLGKRWASKDNDNKCNIVVCEFGDNTKKRLLRGHRDEITIIAWDQLGRRLASASDGKDCTVRLWDVDSEHEVSRIKVSAHCIAWDPNGEFLATGENNVSGEPAIRVWEVNTGCQVCGIKEDTSILNISWDPLGKHLVTASKKALQIWEVRSGTCLCTIPLIAYAQSIAWRLNAKRQDVLAIAFDNYIACFSLKSLPDKMEARLLWLKGPGPYLNLEGINIEGAVDLSAVNHSLLKQRGAIGEPAEPKTEDATDRTPRRLLPSAGPGPDPALDYKEPAKHSAGAAAAAAAPASQKDKCVVS